MCPFYRTECLRVDCAAFKIRRYFIFQGSEHEARVDLTEEEIKERDFIITAPYCNALKMELPKKKSRIKNEKN
jgi:hypothetical protein